MALAELGVAPHRTAVFSGIGCSGKTNQYVRAYGVHTLHGRVLPFATGAKLANPELHVIAVGGDGDGYGIGAGHFLNAGRRNLDMAYIVFNNNVYGLTKGQASPTLGRGEQTKSLPLPNLNDGIDPLGTAIAAGYTWVGRGYAFQIKKLKSLIVEAVEHKGAALLDVLQPCPTYNNLHDKDYYTPRVHDLADDGYDGSVQDPDDEDEVERKRAEALVKAHARNDRIATGVFYKIRIPTYEERIAGRMPDYPGTYPAKPDWLDDAGRPTKDIGPILEKLRVK